MTEQTRMAWERLLDDGNGSRTPDEMLELCESGRLYDEPLMKVWTIPTPTGYTIGLCFLFGVKTYFAEEKAVDQVRRMAKYVDFFEPGFVRDYIPSALDYAFRNLAKRNTLLLCILEGLKQAGVRLDQRRCDLLGLYLDHPACDLDVAVIRSLIDGEMSLDFYSEEADDESIRVWATRRRGLPQMLLSIGEWLPIKGTQYKLRRKLA